jgi:3-deoxy-D-manno-octulosonate 8-phosphate phosphatase (KDO 8-P phosphatase)
MLFDVDGVMTDGRLWFGPDGETVKAFHVHDGHGIKMLAEAGVQIGVVSGRGSAAAERRMRDLGIRHLRFGVEDKLAVVQSLLGEIDVGWADTGFMGDDWVDLAVMRRAGFAATVANAASQMDRHAHWVSTRNGGEGAVREVAEFILDAQGRLDALVERHCNVGVTQG